MDGMCGVMKLMKKVKCPICHKVMEVSIIYSRNGDKEIKLDVWICKECNLILTQEDLKSIL